MGCKTSHNPKDYTIDLNVEGAVNPIAAMPAKRAIAIASSEAKGCVFESSINFIIIILIF